MMANIKRPISFIAAAASCRRTLVGPIIKGTGAIPVERPQDIAKKCKGKIIHVSKNKVVGVNTSFTQEIQAGGLVTITNYEKKQVKVEQVINDN